MSGNQAIQYLDAPVRVRYSECDPMNVAHHSSYLIWMEIARTDLLRRDGLPYAEFERQGYLFVVAKLDIQYKKPAHYDDDLMVRVWVSQKSRASVEHAYEIYHGNALIVTAQTTLVCLDRQGHIRQIPEGAV